MCDSGVYWQDNMVVEAISSNMNNRTDSVFELVSVKQKFQEIKDKQGFLGSIWNKFKEAAGCGFSEKDCAAELAKYDRGEIAYEEALASVNKYEKRQSNTSELVANILTGVAAIAAATCVISGPIGWLGAILVGAPVGSVVKTGIKMLDRATNNVEKDEFNKKQITKDVISGAVTGLTSAVSSGVGAGIRAGSLKLAVSNGAKCGAKCGALSGASSYLTDVCLDEDKQFSFEDFASTTMTSAFVSGTVGGFVGLGMYGLSDNVGKEVSKSVQQTIVDDSMSSSSRKILGRFERGLLAIA